VLHHAHRFFVPQSYRDQDHHGHFVDEARSLNLEILVQECVPIADLEASNYNHIRWVALEYKQSITLNLTHVVVTKSSPYHKRTNFMNDICAWTGWELTVKSAELVLAVVLLRRQCVPPLADCAQDFSIRVSSPRWAVDEGKVDEKRLLHEARFIADSTMPDTSNCTVPQQMYRDFIQAGGSQTACRQTSAAALVLMAA
ncbi:ML4, partial [Symbiodinium pilosum]